MSQARGSQTSFYLYDETDYGVAPASPSAVLVYAKSFGVSSSQNLLDSETLFNGRERARPTRGNIDVSGDIPTEASAENVGTLLKHAMGTVSTGGLGPYTHDISLGDLPIGMMLEKDYGSNIVGVGRVERFNGCRVSSMSVKIPTEGAPEISFSIKGASSVLDSAILDATPVDNGHTPFSSAELSVIEEGGAAIATITEAEFTLDNGLDDSGFVLGGGGKRAQLPEGFATVTGKITALFDSATLLNKAINGTSSSLRFVFTRGTGDGSAGNEYLEFLLPQVIYERQSPGVDGPSGIKIDLPFRTYYSTGSSGLQAILKNTLATI